MPRDIVDRLYATGNASDRELASLIMLEEPSQLRKAAMARLLEVYGKDVFIRGLIEFTNCCRNDCYYCGIRAGHQGLVRYRMDLPGTMQVVKEGYSLGFRTFVLQGGEDPHYSDGDICSLVAAIKGAFPDCAVTLSIGEKAKESYQAYFDAGADRFLLRHETASKDHYSFLHPSVMSFENRRRCLRDLKDIGYQVGAGFMVGSPGQTIDNLVSDLRYLQELQPDMVGIGPFIPADGTPFASEPAGSVEVTLNLISIIRLMLPHAMIPSTTSLSSLDPKGCEHGLEAGANVLMPNLTPSPLRCHYSLYDHKSSAGADVVRDGSLRRRLLAIGRDYVVSRGDVVK